MQNQQLIQAVHRAWQEAAPRRLSRQRFKRYTYGDQWGDTIRDRNGNLVTEADYIRSTGRQPLVNNLIRRLVKSLVGRKRTLDASRPTLMPPDVAALNSVAELAARLFEEFLISGGAIQRKAPDARPAGAGVWIDNVSPDRFITGPFSDPRGHDVEMLAMLHDFSFPQLLARFGGGSPSRAKWLERTYADVDRSWVSRPVTAADNSFFTCPDSSKCRVIELWTLDTVSAPNGTPASFRWRCRWLSPAGDILAEHGAPDVAASHPFVFKFHPFTDGEVHSFVEDILDQQRYVNRLIVMIDKIMGTSAKGVLLFPENQKPTSFSWDDIVSSWTSTDGVIPITGRSNILPQQIVGNGADAGAHRLLELQLRLFQDISGVSEAFFGKSNSGTTGSALYESQVSNSIIALADIFDTFSELITRRDNRALALSTLAPSQNSH